MSADQNVPYEPYRKPTRRDVFLAMEQIVRRAALREVIKPHYSKAGNGRPPVGLARSVIALGSANIWHRDRHPRSMIDFVGLRGIALAQVDQLEPVMSHRAV